MTNLRRVFTLVLLAAGVAVAARSAVAADYEVKMRNRGPDGLMVFVPAFLKIATGDRVRFVPSDKSHNVASIAGMMPDGATPFSSGLDEALTVQFAKEGVYGYRCNPHYGMGMVGLVAVGAPVNEAAAKTVAHPELAKERFAKLFQQLDASAH